MSYIEKNLLPDERILFRTHKHEIIFFFPIILVIFGFYAFSYMQHDFILAKIKWLPVFLALLILCYTWLEYSVSEYVVTNKRLYLREGFFIRHVNETRLSAIAQVEVDQSLIGQLFNYGFVLVNSFGGVGDTFKLIKSPIEIQKNVNIVLDKMR